MTQDVDEQRRAREELQKVHGEQRQGEGELEDSMEEIVVVLVRPPLEKWMSWGLTLSQYTMQLKGWIRGSVAAESTLLHSCVGKVLATANNTPVRTITEVAAVFEDAEELELRFRSFLPTDASKIPSSPARRGDRGDVVCALALQRIEEWVPWESVLDKGTMILRKFPAGALTARNQRMWEQLCHYSGMVLTKLRASGALSVACSPADVVAATEGCREVELHFAAPCTVAEQQWEKAQQRIRDVVVRVVRSASQQGKPWGLELCPETMELVACPIGVVASSKETRACIQH